MKQQKLTPSQEALYKAMQEGVRVYFMTGIDAHYFRSDRKPLNWKTAAALVDKGWAERVKEDWRGHDLRILPEKTEGIEP